MTPTILVLVGGLALLLVGVGLLGTLLGVRATLAAFGNSETGLIMSGYYIGYIAGTMLVPRVIRHVGHIRCFAAFAAPGFAFGLRVGGPLRPGARRTGDGRSGTGGLTRFVGGGGRSVGFVRALPHDEAFGSARGRAERVRRPGTDYTGGPGDAPRRRSGAGAGFARRQESQEAGYYLTPSSS